MVKPISLSDLQASQCELPLIQLQRIELRADIFTEDLNDKILSDPKANHWELAVSTLRKTDVEALRIVANRFASLLDYLTEVSNEGREIILRIKPLKSDTPSPSIKHAA